MCTRPLQVMAVFNQVKSKWQAERTHRMSIMQERVARQSVADPSWNNKTARPLYNDTVGLGELTIAEEGGEDEEEE